MTGVVGLDLSLTATGMARVDGSGLTIKTKSKDGDRRLEDIYYRVLGELVGADLAVLEDLPYSARQAGVTGMVQGVVRLALLQSSVPYAFVSPATLKKFATGNGRADKPMMAAALIEHYGAEGVAVVANGEQFVWPDHMGAGVNLTDDNQVDAAWLRLAGRTRLGLEPLLADRAHLLDSGKWTAWKDFT